MTGLTLLDRGYTGHEHLQSVGLIHMNGRLYDPKLHRFLQPDNYVQDPNNTQNYNRYGYVLNNPLKYTDPSGEFFFVAMIVGAVIGAYIGGSKANDNWNPIKWDYSSGKTWAGIGTGAIIGAVAGEVAWAGITGQLAFGTFSVSLGAGVAIPGVGTLGIMKSGEYYGSQFTNTSGQTFNQNIGTVPVVKPKSDTNGKSACTGDCDGMMGTEYIGPTPISIFYKNQRPVDIVDKAAQNHDRGYILKGADGVSGALFDLSVLDYDRQLYYSAQSTYYGYFLGNKDNVTNRPISLQTAGRAWAVSAAFGPITVGKTVAKGIMSIPDRFRTFTTEFSNYMTNFSYYYNQQVLSR